MNTVYRGPWLAMALIAGCLMPASALAQTAQLAWDPSADASGYVVRWGSAQGVYPNSVNAGAKASVEITGLIPGATYWAVVEAYNAAGVFSTPSAPVRFVALLGGGRLRRENARADFDGDGRNDLLWQHDTGALAAWTLQGGVTIKTGVDLRDRADASWRIAGTGDFNGDGKPDLVWQHRTDGWVSLWYMDGFTRIGETSLSLLRMPSGGWKIVGVGDLNGDGKPDIAWQHPDHGWLSAWLVNGVTVTNVPMSPGRLLDAPWEIVGVGDFNGDDKSDVLWRHRQRGDMGVWLMDGLTRREYVPLNPGAVSEQDWKIASVVDLDGDGKADLVWRHATHGWVAAWFMNGTTRLDAGTFAVVPSTGYKLVGPK